MKLGLSASFFAVLEFHILYIRHLNRTALQSDAPALRWGRREMGNLSLFRRENRNARKSFRRMRLRLTDTERTELRITTIGAFDFGKAERAERRKIKQREAARIRRAKRSSGKPRGRPKLNASPAGSDYLGGDAFNVSFETPAFAKLNPGARESAPLASGTVSSAQAIDKIEVPNRNNRGKKRRVATDHSNTKWS